NNPCSITANFPPTLLITASRSQQRSTRCPRLGKANKRQITGSFRPRRHGVDLAPRRADLPAGTAGNPRGAIQGLAGEGQRGGEGRPLEPRGGRCVLWSPASAARGFAMRDGDTPYLNRIQPRDLKIRMKRSLPRVLPAGQYALSSSGRQFEYPRILLRS